MTALMRIGGEWTPFDVGDESGFTRAGAGFTGLLSSEQVTIVEPGRTGGALYRCAVEDGIGAWVVGQAAAHTPTGGSVIPEIERGVVARMYFKINQYPDAEDGFPIMALTADGMIGNPWVWLFGDGGLGVSERRHNRHPDDPTYVVPLDEWVMIEMAVLYRGVSNPWWIMRVTIPGEEPTIIHCGVQGPSPDGYEFGDFGLAGSGVGAGSVICGALGDGGEGFVIDVDDIGMNSLDGDEHNTWLGPGEVRMARPTSVVADRVFVPGHGANTSGGLLDGTIVSHGADPDPDDLELCGSTDFAGALGQNPVVNPATGGSPGSPHARCADDDIMVSSSGSDYHKHNGVWAYDWPRTGSAGDLIEATCDASDQSGDISFAMPVAIGGHDPVPDGPDPDEDYYASIYTDYEAAPTPGDINDRATIVVDELGAGTAGNSIVSDQGWWGWCGRLGQSPALGSAPKLYLRREHASTSTDDVLFEPPEYGAEWATVGAGIVYESGYEEQPPIKPCNRLVSLV